MSFYEYGLVMTILLFSIITLIYDFIYCVKVKRRKISSQNKILFYKLRKQYLNNCSINDIEELIIFLNDYIQERKEKNEN